MDEELKYQKINDIQVDSKLISSIAFKPLTSPIVIGIVGIVLMLVNVLGIRILGAFFIAMASFVLFFVKDKKTIDIYERGCVIYHSKNSELAYYLDFSLVEEWDILHESGHDTVEFTLLDKNRVIVDTFQSNKVYTALDKIIPDKYHLAVVKKRNKDLNASPVDAVRNLLKKKDTKTKSNQ